LPYCVDSVGDVGVAVVAVGVTAVESVAEDSVESVVDDER
jgi:hypothetical protein